MKKPVILCTGGLRITENQKIMHALYQDYSSAVIKNGGLPILALSTTDAASYADLCDGLLLTGGADLQCSLYGEKKQYSCVNEDALRDRLELDLLNEFVKHSKPVLGICRGIQVINVFFGGNLWQDLPAQLNCIHSGGIMHKMHITPGSHLEKLLGSEISVNSYHHQNIKELGHGLKETAFWMSDDNSIHLTEGIEHEALPISAVQWHPERMESEIWFQDFINCCLNC